VRTASPACEAGASRPSTAARHWLYGGVLPGVYEPRSTAGTVLHQVVGMHLDRFLAETAAATDGVGVPRFRKAANFCYRPMTPMGVTRGA